LPGFSEILRGYLGILHRSSGILLRFSTNQNFWGCDWNPCIPASYTTGLRYC